MEIALRYLGSRPRSRRELTDRLRRGGVPDPTIDLTLERLQEYGYADDAAFVRWWTEQRDRHAPRGRRLLESELRQRGVPRDVIHDSYADERGEWQPEDEHLPVTESERARAVLDRHLRGRPVPTDARALQRLGSFLMRRGFDAETVRSAIRSAGAAVDSEE